MYGTMYGTMDLVFPVMCIAVIAIVIFSFAKGMQEWNDNNKAPLLIVAAKVVGKRQNTAKEWLKALYFMQANMRIFEDMIGPECYETATNAEKENMASWKNKNSNVVPMPNQGNYQNQSGGYQNQGGGY